MTTVDRRLTTPLYVQLESALLAHIAQWGLKPGDRLPTENSIAETYGVSRQTIRQALTRMVADGFVERVQGSGSFVAKPRPSHQSLLTSFTQNMRSQGYDPQRTLVQSSLVESLPEPASPGMSEGPYQFISRLLLVNGCPLAIADTWLPVECLGGRLDLFTPEVLEASSLYEVLQGPDIGLRLARGVEKIRAALATSEQAQQLEVDPGSPTLVVRRVSYTPSERPVEWTVMTFAADRYEYNVELAGSR